MWPFSKKETPRPRRRKEETRAMYATDDTLRRAENIVFAVGYRGHVGHIVLNVYRVLKDYERLDEQARDVSPSTEGA